MRFKYKKYGEPTVHIAVDKVEVHDNGDIHIYSNGLRNVYTGLYVKDLGGNPTIDGEFVFTNYTVSNKNVIQLGNGDKYSLFLDKYEKVEIRTEHLSQGLLRDKVVRVWNCN